MPAHLWHLLTLVLCLAVLGMPSCGAPAADPCRLERCDPEGTGAAVCSSLDATVATTLDEAARFLVEGPTPLQTGVASGVIAKGRAAVVRGKVTHDGGSVVGAAISIAGHPEYGRTVSRCDGAFEVALAEGGVVQASWVSDRDGDRRATLLFQPGTVATTSGAPLDTALHVRATEYTVGPDGPSPPALTCTSSSAAIRRAQEKEVGHGARRL